MEKEKMMSFSILCLAISLIISAGIISKGMEKNGDRVNSGLSSISQGVYNVGNTISHLNNNNASANKNTLDLFSASSYLGIKEGRLKEIIDAEGSGIPYVKIGEQYIFSKSALDKWLETARIEIK